MRRHIEGSRLDPEEQSEVREEIEKVLARGARRGTGGFITRIREFFGAEANDEPPRIKQLIAESLIEDGAPGNSYAVIFELESGELLAASVDLEGTEASVYHGRNKDTGLPKDLEEGSRTRCYIAEDYAALASPFFLPEDLRVRLADALAKAGLAKASHKLLKSAKIKPIGTPGGLDPMKERELRAHIAKIEAERKTRARQDAEELEKKKTSGDFERTWEQEQSHPKKRHEKSG